MARAPKPGATSQALQRPIIEPAPLRIRAASVTAAGSVGTKEFKPWYMVNTKMTKLKLEIQILLMKYRHLMTPELEQKFDELHDEIESDEE